MFREKIQSVGVQHHRRRHPRDEVLDQPAGRHIAADPGTNHTGIRAGKATQHAAERRVSDHAGRDLGYGPHDHLGAFFRQDRIDRLRHQQANDAGPRPGGPHARQIGGAGEALRSRQHDDRPEGALMPIARTGRKSEAIWKLGPPTPTLLHEGGGS